MIDKSGIKLEGTKPVIDFATILNEKHNINQILKNINFCEFEVKEVLKKYQKNSLRQGIIIRAKELYSGNSQKVIIDTIYGEPNWSQMMDLTFNDGAGCDKRIILFTYDYSKLNEEHLYDIDMATGFAHINNDCGVQTYIIQAMIGNDEIGEQAIFYDIIAEPDGKKRTEYTKLPSKDDFEYFEFGILYNYTIDWELDYVYKPGEWVKDYWQLDYDDINLRYPVWNKNGLFMECESLTALVADGFKKLIQTEMDLFKKFFNTNEITIHENETKSIVASFKLWDRPFSDFIGASPEEKQRLAKMLRRYDGYLFEFWQTFLDDRKSYIVENFDPIPYDAFTNTISN